MPPRTRPHAPAERSLRRAHPAFEKLIRHFGPCQLQPHPDPFAVLVQSIISQQISTRAAMTVAGRLRDLCGGVVTPALLRGLTDEQLQGCGLSTGKRQYLRTIAEHPTTSTTGLAELAALDDTAVQTRLLPIRGIGPWTVQMLLIFGLGRLDVLPVGDLALRLAVRDVLGLPAAPTPAELTALAEPWRPYRTVATWYLWRSREDSDWI